MGTISKTVQQCMLSFWQKQVRIDILTQPGWGDTADNFRETDMKYCPTELMVLEVVKPETDTTAATRSPTTFRELMQGLVIVPRQSQIAQGTSRQGSSQMRLGSEKLEADDPIVSRMPNAVPDLSQREIVPIVHPMSIYPSL